MRSSLSRLFALLLVIVVGLIAGYTVAKFTHVAPASASSAAPMVNIQLTALVVLVWSLATLATGLWLLRGWIARQWSRFTAWLELRLEVLFDDVSPATVDQELGLMRLIKNYDLRFGSGSASALRRAMDAIHRHPDGRLNWQASNSAIFEHMERQLALPEGRQLDHTEWCAYCSGSHSDTPASLSSANFEGCSPTTRHA